MRANRPFFLALLLIWLVTSCDSRSNVSGEIEEPPREGSPAAEWEIEKEYTTVPGTRIELLKPVGFLRSSSFPGFMQESMGATIMVTEMRAPYSELTAEFNASRIEAGGMSLLDKQDLAFEEFPGMLLHLTQSIQEMDFIKWVAIFGNEEQTVMITASFPREHAAVLSAPFRRVVVEARYDAKRVFDPFADLGYKLSSTSKLPFTQRVGNMLAYTMDRVFPAKSPEHPLLVVGQALSKLEIEDGKEFAERRIRQTAAVEGIEIVSTAPITVDDLPGFESEARARLPGSGEPMFVYQVILFDGDSYYLIQGLAGDRFREEYLPEFRESARSLERKRGNPDQERN